MSQTLSRAEREAVFEAAAKRMYHGLEDWYDQHPEASLGEIEQAARRLRRVLMGETLQLLANGRDAGYRKERPRCAQCGRPMEFEGYRLWGVSSLEGDVQLRRAYYHCPDGHGEGFFPPGSEVETAGGSLE